MPTRVLLLEEDATYARELLHGLSEAGIEVTLARDGDAGLARAVAERFDALVVSAELPGINGFRLCIQQLRSYRMEITPTFTLHESYKTNNI